jgi:RNA recognition motif-containing protein
MSRRRVFCGNISRRTRERDIEDLFDRYGRIARIDFKDSFCMFPCNCKRVVVLWLAPPCLPTPHAP